MKVAALLCLLTGCSWLMVAGPPPAALSTGAPGTTLRLDEPLDCTRQRFAPIVDTVVASVFGLGTAIAVPAGALAVTSDDEWNRMFGGMLLGTGAVYALLALPFVRSAKTGYRDVAACRRAHQLQAARFGAGAY